VFDIVLNGLQPTIRMHVMQRNATTIDELIKFAKIAEAVVLQASETYNVLLMELMRASVETGQKQAEELKHLASKVAALSVTRVETEICDDGDASDRPTAGQRQVLQTDSSAATT